jgi:hypothetical protein
LHMDGKRTCNDTPEQTRAAPGKRAGATASSVFRMARSAALRARWRTQQSNFLHTSLCSERFFATKHAMTWSRGRLYNARGECHLYHAVGWPLPGN